MSMKILTVSNPAAGENAATQALREAGFDVLLVDDTDAAAAALRACDAALVVCDGKLLDASDAGALARAVAAVAGEAAKPGLPRDVARSISHDLRTPLSAMAGWLHLMESGKLDEAGLKRAIGKLRANIDDQVRTIDRHLGATQEGQRT
jgi:signal transduction histidine kinase